MQAQLLEILVCPITKGRLILDHDKQEFISLAARLAYPICNDIPILKEQDARELSLSEYEHWSKK